MSGLFRFGLVVVGVLSMMLASVASADTVFTKSDPGWRDYKDRFLLPEGRIIDTANGNVSHTEGQGWGMFLAVRFQDREVFDRLWQWTESHLARQDVALFSWRYDPSSTPAVADPNNATDGDLFIAWALQLASDLWDDPRYARRSDEVRQAIVAHLVADVGGYQVLLPAFDGFRHDDYADLNLSYWVIPALRDFAARYPDEPWQVVIDSGRQLLERAQFGRLQLPADWLRLGNDGQLAPARAWPPRFGFENVRVPLYFTWGGMRDIDTLENIARYWDRPAPPAWIDVDSDQVADYPLSQGGKAINALLTGRPWAIPATADEDENYYSATLLMLSRVAAKQISLSWH